MTDTAMPEPVIQPAAVQYGSIGASRIVFSDGSVFVAEHDELPADFWTRHPLMEETAPATPELAPLATRVWLTTFEKSFDDAPTLPTSLDRPRDLRLFGTYDAGEDFWALHPDIEAFNYVFMDDPDSFGSWQVDLWLKQP